MIALDTNLLVYAHRSKVPEHQAARKAIERAARSRAGCGISLPCLAEFWSVVTHPAMPGRPSTPGEASSFLKALLDDGGVEVWTPQPGFRERWMQIAEDLEVRGSRIFDLQIALMAFDGGATEIWTHDAGFLTMPGLKRHDPL